MRGKLVHQDQLNNMKFFKNKLLEVRDQKLAVGNERGGAEVFIVVIVILIAFLLAGGEFLLGNAFPLPDSLGIGGGTPVGSAPGASPSAQWEVTLEDGGCNATTGQALYTAGLFGPTRGYYTLSVRSGASYTPVLSELFTEIPNQAVRFELDGDDGFRNNPWKVELFEMNPISPESVTGGALKATADGQPTGC